MKMYASWILLLALYLAVAEVARGANVGRSNRPTCTYHEQTYDVGDVFPSLTDGPCTECECTSSGFVTCSPKTCAMPDCAHPIIPRGRCCPVCSASQGFRHRQNERSAATQQLFGKKRSSDSGCYLDGQRIPANKIVIQSGTQCDKICRCPWDDGTQARLQAICDWACTAK